MPEINYRFQPKVYDGCHDFMKKYMSVNDGAILPVKGNGYRIHLWYMCKGEAINLLKNTDLRGESEI